MWFIIRLEKIIIIYIYLYNEQNKKTYRINQMKKIQKQKKIKSTSSFVILFLPNQSCFRFIKESNPSIFRILLAPNSKLVKFMSDDKFSILEILLDTKYKSVRETRLEIF